MSPTTEKSHVSDILYKAYMDKTIICCVHSQCVPSLQSCICAWSPCVRVLECLGIQDSLQDMCTNNLISYDRTLF